MMINMAKICEFCGTTSEQFTGKMSFWRHVKKHEKTTSQCNCDCDKVFNSKRQSTQKQLNVPVVPNYSQHQITWKSTSNLKVLKEYARFAKKQVMEESHKKFAIFWDRYKVLDLESEMHGEHLLNCLIDFNTKNI